MQTIVSVQWCVCCSPPISTHCFSSAYRTIGGRASYSHAHVAMPTANGAGLGVFSFAGLFLSDGSGVGGAFTFRERTFRFDLTDDNEVAYNIEVCQSTFGRTKFRFVLFAY